MPFHSGALLLSPVRRFFYLPQHIAIVRGKDIFGGGGPSEGRSPTPLPPGRDAVHQRMRPSLLKARTPCPPPPAPRPSIILAPEDARQRKKPGTNLCDCARPGGAYIKIVCRAPWGCEWRTSLRVWRRIRARPPTTSQYHRLALGATATGRRWVIDNIGATATGRRLGPTHSCQYPFATADYRTYQMRSGESVDTSSKYTAGVYAHKHCQ